MARPAQVVRSGLWRLAGAGPATGAKFVSISTSANPIANLLGLMDRWYRCLADHEDVRLHVQARDYFEDPGAVEARAVDRPGGTRTRAAAEIVRQFGDAQVVLDWLRLATTDNYRAVHEAWQLYPIARSVVDHAVLVAEASNIPDRTHAATTSGPARRKRRSSVDQANREMMTAIQDEPDRMKSSAHRWAKYIGCSSSTIIKTAMWIQSEKARAQAKQVRQQSSRGRRRPRHYSQS
jgi:hypothetical protein